jgi:hypothetical protein
MTCPEPDSVLLLPSRPRQPESQSNPELPTIDIQKPLHPVRKHRIAPPLADRADRTSFSSTKESDTGIAQSFTDSKTSSYLRWEVGLPGAEDAIDDDLSVASGLQTPVEAAMLNPQSTLHGVVCPCDSFRGWKSISIGGKVASKSFGDLRRLALRWDWEARDERPRKAIVPLETPAGTKVDGTFLPGQSPFERLPMELLGEFVPSSPAPPET